MGKRGHMRERGGGNEVKWRETSGNGVDLRGFTPMKARLREKKEEEEEEGGWRRGYLYKIWRCRFPIWDELNLVCS